MAGFGTPNHGGNFKPSPKSLPKEGNLTFRILPPILDCIETGEWNIPHVQHFGYDTTHPTDSSKRKWNTFYCLEISKWEDGQRITVQSCPECELIAVKKAEFDASKAALEKDGVSEADVREAMKPALNWVIRHNRDFKQYVNVKDSAGEYYTLKLPNKVKKLIDGINKEMREKKPNGLDPIAAHQGLWFTVIKTGKKLQTEYAVKYQTEDKVIDNETFQKAKLAPMTEQDATAAELKCHDLHDVGIRRLSLDKVKMLVESGGDEKVIEAVFKSSEKRDTASPAPAPEKPQPKPVVQSKPQPEPKPQPKPESKPVPTKVAEPPEDDDVAKAMKALAAAQERARLAKSQKEAAAKVPAPTPEPTPTPTPTSDEGGPDIEDEEAFIAQYRV